MANNQDKIGFMKENKKEIRWYYRPWIVLGLLLFVLGPLGLPLVYKSPKFNRTWKVMMTLVMIAYTWYLIVATVSLTKSISTSFSQLSAVLE